MVMNDSMEMMITDLECGGTVHHHHLHHTSTDQSCYYSQEEEEEEEEVGSCYSQFYTSNDNEDNTEIARLSDCSDCSVVQIHDDEKNVVVIVVDDDRRRDCRICQLSVADDDDDDDDYGEEEGEELIELGCCCKDDLALVHRHCADTWFKIKGNKICEICNSIVTNLVVANETPSTTQGTMDVNPAATSVATRHMSTATRGGRGCVNGHRLLNFILACLVFAFVISWLFHFNIPS